MHGTPWISIVLVSGCLSADPVGDDPLRPRPIPEPGFVPTLDASRIEVERTAQGLRLLGHAGAVRTPGDVGSVVITATQSRVEVLEVAAQPDASFAAELAEVPETVLLSLTPVAGATLGSTLFLRLEADGQLREQELRLCLAGGGLWDLGATTAEGPAFTRTLQLVNHCGATLDLTGARLRFGEHLRAELDPRPGSLAPGESLSLTLRFERGDSAQHAWFDFVEFPKEPNEPGFVVRVRR